MNKTIALAVAAAMGLGVASMAYAQDGAALFQKNMCGACHGAGKKGPDLKATKLDKAAAVKYMKDPKSVNPSATMKPVKGTDAELDAIYDYMKK